MRALKPVPEDWPIPTEERCVYEKRVSPGPLIRCRYRATAGEIGILTVRGYCGIHLRMVKKRREANQLVMGHLIEDYSIC